MGCGWTVRGGSDGCAVEPERSECETQAALTETL